MTMDSPKFVGTVLTRRSSSRSPIFTWMRPSCGMRRSERSMFAISLTRERMAPCRRLGGGSISRSAPSMRKRTRKRFSIGSRWMSEAFILQASMRMRLTRRMTGASPSPASSTSISLRWLTRPSPVSVAFGSKVSG